MLQVIVFIINYGPSFLPYENTPIMQNKSIFFTFSALLWIIQLAIGIGYTKITLDFVHNKKPEMGELISGFQFLFNTLIGYLLSALIIGAGLLLLIVPGIIWAIKLQFFKFYILEGAGPVEAMKKSWAATSGLKWKLFLFDLVLIVINIAGLIVFGLGLFITIPVTSLAEAYVYKKLSPHKK